MVNNQTCAKKKKILMLTFWLRQVHQMSNSKKCTKMLRLLQKTPAFLNTSSSSLCRRTTTICSTAEKPITLTQRTQWKKTPFLFFPTVNQRNQSVKLTGHLLSESILGSRIDTSAEFPFCFSAVCVVNGT